MPHKTPFGGMLRPAPTSCRATRRAKLLACLLLPPTMLAGCTGQERESRQVARPVQVFRVGDGSAQSAMRFAGEVRARYETQLSFRVAGKVSVRRVEVGDPVRQGQLLARLDPADYRLAVDGLKAQLAAARAERDFSRDDLARYRELLAQRLISPPELDRRDTAYTAARQRVTALEAQLGQAANQLAYTELRADRDGVVTALETEAGQVVAAGQPVARIAQSGEKEVWIDVPEQRLAGIGAGQAVSVTLWADGQRRLQGRIRELAPAADAASRTYRVKAALVEGREAAQLGMTATVWIPSDEPGGVAIPLAAVFTPQNQPAQPRVWLVDEASHTVKSWPVRIGATLGGERIVVAGLSAGQTIVSAGVQRLREGQSVRLPEAATPAPPAPGREIADRRP